MHTISRNFSTLAEKWSFWFHFKHLAALTKISKFLNFEVPYPLTFFKWWFHMKKCSCGQIFPIEYHFSFSLENKRKKNIFWVFEDGNGLVLANCLTPEDFMQKIQTLTRGVFYIEYSNKIVRIDVKKKCRWLSEYESELLLKEMN